MAKKGSRLREFEKNNRVLDITGAQEERRKKRNKKPKTIREASAQGESTVVASTEEKKTEPKNIKMISIIVSVIFLFAVAMSAKNIIDLRAEKSALENRNAELLYMKEELTLELQNINSAEYIENQARKELRLAKADELIFYFPEDFQLKEGEKE